MTQVILAPEVAEALHAGRPVVALESTVISHGLPWPENLALANKLENLVRGQGATPATIALIAGQPKVGLAAAEIEQLADGSRPIMKISRRDFGVAITQKAYGATTVAATMIMAHKAGISVFATGGIGGVHLGHAMDISADLPELSQTPVAVVCAGAKSILDLPRTLEWLETYGVPVIGYGTSEFPAFYTPSSGLKLEARADTPDEAAAMINAHWGFGLHSGVLVAVPVPATAAMDSEKVKHDINQALHKAETQKISGKDTTPFLLKQLVDISGGDTLRANLALLEQNAVVAAQIAVALANRKAR